MPKIVSALAYVLLYLCALTYLTEPVSAETVLVNRNVTDLNGSGAVIEQVDGVSYILTARHVCLEARDLTIQRETGTEVYPANVYRIHTHEDLCLLTARGPFKVTYVEPNPADREDIAFIKTLMPGPAAGLTVPILCLEKDYAYEFEVNFQRFLGPIYPGMSGSPVLNKEGFVIGVVILGINMDGMQGGFVPLEYVHELLRGIDSLTYSS